ncbi:MAG: 30S ribosomal protein S27ae [Candidatus Thermoplasmatota archaeon]
MSKRSCYEVKDGRLERKRQPCPKCGPGTFMAVHKDRTSCGRCGYTEYTAKGSS